MGKRTLIKGIIIGAVIGGLTTLRKEEVRAYTKHKLQETKDTTVFYLKTPSEAVRNLRKSINMLSSDLTDHADQAINALEQLESTIDSFVKKDDTKHLQ